MSTLSHKEKIEEIAEIINKMGNEWECKFIKDMQKRKHDPFSPKQQAQINRLYEKACQSPY